MKNVVLFLAEGFEEIEALTTIDVLRRAEIPVTIASINSDKRVKGAHDVCIEADTVFGNVNFHDFDMIILPGGMPGAKNLNEHSALKKEIANFANSEKYVAAICAAPMILGGLNLLEGKKATCYPGFESELIGSKITSEKVTVDKNIITGKGPGFAIDFALQIVETIAGKSVRDEVANGLLV